MGYNRDFLLELKRWTPRVEDAEAQPALAKTRVREFWGPVYKQFIVRGPGKFYVKVGKNNSYNTTLQGVMLDSLTAGGPTVTDLYQLMEESGTPLPQKVKSLRIPLFDVHHLDAMGDVRYSPPPYEVPRDGSLQANANDPTALVKAAQDLWVALDKAYGEEDSSSLQGFYRLLAYRAVASSDNKNLDALLASWRWRLKLWTPQEREHFKEVMEQGYESNLKQAEFRKGKVLVTTPVGEMYYTQTWQEPDAATRAFLNAGQKAIADHDTTQEAQRKPDSQIQGTVKEEQEKHTP